MRGAYEEGREKLRSHILDCQTNGPARLERLEGEIGKIEHVVTWPEIREAPKSASEEATTSYTSRSSLWKRT